MRLATLRFEQRFWKQGVRFVAGVDEVGRGAYAGPVVAGAVLIPDPSGFSRRGLMRIRDSKKVSEKEREELYERLIVSGIIWSVGVVDVVQIDRIGIGRANRQVVVAAVRGLAIAPNHVLVDAICVPELRVAHTAVPNGDDRVFSIAAASIIAKVTRDRLMRQLHARYPRYGFARHKGYGTAAHQRALAKHGPCPEHRRSFGPIRVLCDR